MTHHLARFHTFCNTQTHSSAAALHIDLNNLPHAIRPEDIMPLMNKIFYKSYNNVANNKKAVGIRGWYPPNMALLEHPSLIADENINTPPQSSSSLPFP